MLQIYVDANACPVKQEIYKVAQRYALPVVLVANSRMGIPYDGQVSLQVVPGGMDEADDWIAERVEADDVVVTVWALPPPVSDPCPSRTGR